MNGLKPYTGSEPYVFISYAHADEQAVGSVLENLERNGVRFWYDDGIEAGSEWPEYIAARLAAADTMIAFVSNAYAASHNCRKELHYAVTKGIRTINVFLEDAALTPGMALQIGNIFALMKYRMEEHDFYDRLYRALQTPAKSEPDAEAKEKAGKPAPEKRRKPIRPILRAVLGILLTAVVLSGICFIPAAVSVRQLSRRREPSAFPAKKRLPRPRLVSGSWSGKRQPRAFMWITSAGGLDTTAACSRAFIFTTSNIRTRTARNIRSR